MIPGVDWFGAGLIFVIVWWLILFMVLPFGAHPPDEIEPGTTPSAPAKPRLGLKFAITTVIALVVTAAIVWLLQSGMIALRPAA
jgi:predicted secreted protein